MMARSWRSQIADEVRATSMMKPRPLDHDMSTDPFSATPAPDGMEVVAWDRLRELIGEYFDLGYAEGVVQRDADTMAGDAQRTLSEIETIISQAQAALAAMRVERDEARQVVRDTHWMAVRYADGRQSYAVGMCADALRKAYDAGWLTYSGGQPHHDLDPQYPRDGSKPEYQSVEARAETAEAQVKRLTEDKEALRGAAKEAEQALCDWLNTYASDMCSPVHVGAAQERLRERGTIAYIADKLKVVRAALSGSEKE